MKILVTNSSLNWWGGSQTFLRNLSIALQEKGHEVVAFSSLARVNEPVLDADSIRSVTDLEGIDFVPDIIHAQSHMDALTAMTAFPEASVINHIHGAVWKESPLVHPRIGRYLAITPTLKERLSIEFSIPQSKIHVVLNGIDTRRFEQVNEPPRHLKRTLVFSRYHAPDSPVGRAIVDACDRLGITLDFIGMGVRRLIKNPETVLPNYDLVFASGISAMDAAACGCAVIILGQTNCGPLLDETNYERFRLANFNIPMISGATTSAIVESELRQYSPTVTARITHRLRTETDMKIMVETILRHYEEVIESDRQRVMDRDAESAAVSAYLQWIAPAVRILEDFERRPRPLPLSMDEVLADLQRELKHLDSELEIQR
jgi:hypothetical protein